MAGLLERLGTNLASWPATPFYLSCCLAVIVLTVAGELALTVAGVPESRILAALAPAPAIAGILVVALRKSTLADSERAAAHAEVERRVEEVIARARSMRDVIRLVEGAPGSAPDPHRILRWEAVAGALEEVARRTGDPADVAAAREAAELCREFRVHPPPPPPSPFGGAPP